MFTGGLVIHAYLWPQVNQEVPMILLLLGTNTRNNQLNRGFMIGSCWLPNLESKTCRLYNPSVTMKCTYLQVVMKCFATETTWTVSLYSVITYKNSIHTFMSIITHFTTYFEYIYRHIYVQFKINWSIKILPFFWRHVHFPPKVLDQQVKFQTQTHTGNSIFTCFSWCWQIIIE